MGTEWNHSSGLFENRGLFFGMSLCTAMPSNTPGWSSQARLAGVNLGEEVNETKRRCGVAGTRWELPKCTMTSTARISLGQIHTRWEFSSGLHRDEKWGGGGDPKHGFRSFWCSLKTHGAVPIPGRLRGPKQMPTAESVQEGENSIVHGHLASRGNFTGSHASLRLRHAAINHLCQGGVRQALLVCQWVCRFLGGVRQDCGFPFSFPSTPCL